VAGILLSTSVFVAVARGDGVTTNPVALEPAVSTPLAASSAAIASLPAGSASTLSRGSASNGNAPLRIGGIVGPDLTRSLRAAGVPETQGRAYLAALATSINLSTGISVDDRFDLIIDREDGRLGGLVYAGLDRVGRNDVELMWWTEGSRTRWVDAQTLGAEQGMEMPVSGRVTSGFGERFHPILQRRRMHDGVDLAAAYGSPIVAATDGRVISAGWRGGYGRAVAIQHAGGIETLYGHMSRLAASAGQWVRQGQVIGYVGSSGLSTGPHIHYEVHKGGRLVNPLSVRMVVSPIQGEELHAFNNRLRGLLTSGNSL
jgi:murein DD-endopeptidase MepM/ murein hydrolase activator NlpD